MSSASASVTTSASSPSMTERACLPEPPCDCLMVTSWPVLRLPVLGEGRVEVLVELARRVVGDVEQRDVVWATAPRSRHTEEQGSPQSQHVPAREPCDHHLRPFFFIVPPEPKRATI